MIAHLCGTAEKTAPGEIIVHTGDVGYRVMVPLPTWEALEKGGLCRLWISPYIREDRFDLFGFLDRSTQVLFASLLKLSGIGPRTALELCSVPPSLLLRAVQEQNAAVLKGVKGVGRKTGEKLLVELKSLLEQKPDLLGGARTEDLPHEFDQDAIAALTTLGYDPPSAIAALKRLPPALRSTEERVAAALRSL